MSSGKEIDQQVNSIHILGGSDINEEKPSQTQKAMDLKVNGGTMIKKSLVVLGNIYGNRIKPRSSEEEIIIEGNVTVAGTLTTTEPAPLTGNIITSLIEEEIPNGGITINGNVTVNGTLDGSQEYVYTLTAGVASSLSDVVGVQIMPAPPAGYYYFFEYIVGEYIYDGATAWTQARPLRLADSTNTASYASNSQDNFTGTNSRGIVFIESSNNSMNTSAGTSIHIFSATAGNIWSSTGGSTVARIRMRYRLFPLTL